jgi:hypothetical protein
MVFDLSHLPGTKNFEVALRFLENMCSSAVGLYCTNHMVPSSIRYVGALRGSLRPSTKFARHFILDSERAVSILSILWSVSFDTRTSLFSWHIADREHTTVQWGNHMPFSCLCNTIFFI